MSVSEKYNTLKVRSYCIGRCKEDTKRKQIMPSVEKRYASFVCKSIISYVLNIKHSYFICGKGFELHLTFWTDELSAVHDVNLQHIQATNGPCPVLFLKRLWYPFCFLLAFYRSCPRPLLSVFIIKFSTGLLIIEANKKRMAITPKFFGRPLCPFCIRSVFIGLKI